MLVAVFKYISSTIDEQRQKAILNEKAKIETAKEGQLDKCIAETQMVLHRKLADNLQILADAVRRGEISQPQGSVELDIGDQAARDQAEKDKAECFKRYK